VNSGFLAHADIAPIGSEISNFGTSRVLLSDQAIKRVPLPSGGVPVVSSKHGFFSEAQQTLEASGRDLEVRFHVVLRCWFCGPQRPTQTGNRRACDSIFSAGFFNRAAQTGARRELCSLIGSFQNADLYQWLTKLARGDASVICATHGQKRFAPTRFAALLYCDNLSECFFHYYSIA